MRLIRLVELRPIADTDVWTHIGDDAPLPDSAPVIVSLNRWQTGREALGRRNAPVGLRLAAGETLEALTDDLDCIDLVALDFPSLADGRHFTTARLLRERHGFRGEIRATGQVLRDQLFAMARCGFDSFELAAHQDAAAAQRALDEISVVFQPAADGRTDAWAIRGRQSGAYVPSA